MEQIPKRVYTAEFRQEAVKLVEQGLSQREVARRLEISTKTLGNWVVRARAGQLSSLDTRRAAPVSVEQAELARLKRENAVLREERDILKKAAAFFAKESR
jgi:transposase